MKPKTIHDMTLLRTTITFLLTLLILAGCREDDEGTTVEPFTGDTKTYLLDEVNDSGLNGYVVFTQEEDGPLNANITLLGTESGESYPVNIYTGAVIEGGSDVEIPLGTVEGGSGRLTTPLQITFDELLAYDGYIGATDNGNFVMLGDIGGNELSNTSKEYSLAARNNSELTGTITFTKRNNNTTLVTIEMDSTVEGSVFPAGIYSNSAVEEGDLQFDLAPVEDGMSMTNLREFDDGTATTYDELIGDADDEDEIFGYDGYVNVFRSADGPVISQADIGSNELTGESVEYPLNPVDVADISGTATFEQRKNNETLVTITLEGTPDSGEHPAHIHANTAAEGGGIVIDLTTVDGATGLSITNVSSFNDGNSITYEELIDYNGYINVHESAMNLATIVAQGDIGQNALTGESVTYALDSVAVPTITGTATFSQRNNGNTLVEIMLEGTPEDGKHPAHIHANTAAEGGEIAIDLDTVDGTTGLSRANVTAFNDGTPVSYEQLLEYDGYINVHFSEDALETIVAQGDIGQNALTGEEITYSIMAVDANGKPGTLTLAERENGSTLATVMLENTISGESYPVYIQADSVNSEGDQEVIVTLNSVQGVASGTAVSKTNIEKRNLGLPVTYEDLIMFDGQVTVRSNTGVTVEDQPIVGQGNIGSNVETEEEETEGS